MRTIRRLDGMPGCELRQNAVVLNGGAQFEAIPSQAARLRLGFASLRRGSAAVAMKFIIHNVKNIKAN